MTTPWTDIQGVVILVNQNYFNDPAGIGVHTAQLLMLSVKLENFNVFHLDVNIFTSFS